MTKFSGIFGKPMKQKFQKFTSSGTFTPTQALLDTGGVIHIFIVGGGGNGDANRGGSGGEVLKEFQTVTSINGCTVTIGGIGSPSSVNLVPAGGVLVTAVGGSNSSSSQSSKLSPSWGLHNTTHGSPAQGVDGYGAGGKGIDGIITPKVNSGQGGGLNTNGATGYCLITWWE